MADLPHNFPDVFETPEDEFRAANGIYLFLQDGIFSYPDDMEYQAERYDASTQRRYLHKTSDLSNYANQTNVFLMESFGEYGRWSIEVAAEYGEKSWKPLTFKFLAIEGDRMAFKMYAQR